MEPLSLTALQSRLLYVNPLDVMPIWQGSNALPNIMTPPTHSVWQQRGSQPDRDMLAFFCLHPFLTSPYLYHPDGKMKIPIYQPGINDWQYGDILRHVRPQALKDRVVQIEDGFYESIDATELSHHEVLKYCTNDLQAEQDAVDNGIFQILAQGDSCLIRTNHKMTARRGGLDVAMGLWIDEKPTVPVIGFWNISGIPRMGYNSVYGQHFFGSKKYLLAMPINELELLSKSWSLESRLSYPGFATYLLSKIIASN